MSLLKFFLASAIYLHVNTFSQQKANWTGSNYIENGIKIVKNSGGPLYGELKLELLEELSIGDKNTEEYSFSLISDVKTDSAGNIYVADTKNLRILKFDRSGLYLKTLGSGVVEFEQPSKIRIDKISKTIFVRASVQRIEIFDNKDEYKNRIEVKKVSINDFDIIS